MTSQPTLAGAKPQMTVFANLAVRSTFPSYMLSLAKTLGVLSFTPLTMLQACAQAVDFKVGHHFGEGQRQIQVFRYRGDLQRTEESITVPVETIHNDIHLTLSQIAGHPWPK